jgi:hypothetical protein
MFVLKLKKNFFNSEKSTTFANLKKIDANH